MGHKIHKAMADRDSLYQLTGLVKMDDAFIGPKKPGPRGQGSKGKAKVVIAVESRDKHAGFAVIWHVPSVDSDQILSMSQDKIQPTSDIRTDGWRAYQTLESNGFCHEPAIVSKDKEALKQLKWVHVLTANVKGNIRGSTMVSVRSISAGIWLSFIPVQPTSMGFTAFQSYHHRMPHNFYSNICGVKGMIEKILT